jgi:3-deoxy-D-manno-octulosonic-acid transferase
VFARGGIGTLRFTDLKAGIQSPERVVIFNTIGMLARLYKQTDIAFIGGSFGKGTHNVMEPAIFGQPVLFGPNHLNSHEAGELLSIGAAFTIHGEDEFFNKVALLIRNDQLRTTMGEKARNLIHDNIGATAKIINKLKIYGILPQVYTN